MEKKNLRLKESFSTNEHKINLLQLSHTENFIHISTTNKYVEYYAQRSFSITSSSVKITQTRYFKSHVTMLSAIMNVQRECRCYVDDI
jgi:hypothetical protein